MCGIAGFFKPSNKMNQDQMTSMVSRMADTLVHRGPDSSGTWAVPQMGVALGHRRLAVIDLSQNGHQPMVSHCGRYVTVFNGEIYNFREIKDELFQWGAHFRGDSDTEVLLAAISRWGVQKSLEKFNGMFAFAALDIEERKLYLARDRLGEKPLYYGWMGPSFLFSSELKSIQAHTDFKPEIDRNALALYLRYSYIPSPYSIYRNIYKLPAGTFLCLSLEGGESILPAVSSYWPFKTVAEHALSQLSYFDEHDVVNQLEAMLKKAVGLRMEADVPIGAFLSGGIDSSLIVALMQAQNNERVRTFTIGFYEEGFNEAEEAKEVARYLGTDHIELYVTPEETMSVIPSLSRIYDEPFADSSQIPTILVSKLARGQVTVSLSGDGGDELFGGYPRYFSGRTIFNAAKYLPYKGRLMFSRLFGSGGLPLLQTSAKIRRVADILQHSSEEKMYQEMISYAGRPTEIVLNAEEPDTVYNHPEAWLNSQDIFQKMMYFDTLTYLPEDILVKVDRASMSVGLESRAPFLDPQVVEYAWRIPPSMQVKGKEGKYLLKKILGKYMPPVLFQRSKMGFGVPIGPWLRGPLREWAENLIDEKRLRSEGYLNSECVRKKWEAHVSGKSNHQYFLWTVLMFQAWHADQGFSSC